MFFLQIALDTILLPTLYHSQPCTQTILLPSTVRDLLEGVGYWVLGVGVLKLHVDLEDGG